MLVGWAHTLERGGGALMWDAGSHPGERCHRCSGCQPGCQHACIGYKYYYKKHRGVL